MLTSFGANVPVFWSECLLLFCKSPALHHSKPGFRGQKSPAFLRFFFRFTGFRERVCQPKERLSVILTSLSPGVKTNDTDCLRYSDHLPDAVPSALRCTKNNHKLVCYF